MANINVTHSTPVDLDEFKDAVVKQLAEPRALSRDFKPAFVRPASTFVPQEDDTADNPYAALAAAFPPQEARHSAKHPFTGEAITVPHSVIQAQFANAAVLNEVAESHKLQ